MKLNIINNKIIFGVFFVLIILISLVVAGDVPIPATSTSGYGGVMNSNQRILLVSDIEIEVNGEVIDFDEVLTLNVGETIPIRVTFTGNKDADMIIKVSTDAYREHIMDSTPGTFVIQKGVRYIKDLSLELPENMVTGEVLLNFRFSAKNHDVEEIEINTYVEGAEPLEINIINPVLRSTIKGDYVILSVETDRDAVCEYTLRKLKIIYGREIEFSDIVTNTEMFETGGTSHFQLIENLENTIETNEYIERYEFMIICADHQDVVDIEGSVFYVNLTDLKENLILEDIGEWDYTSTIQIDPSDIGFEDVFEGITDLYYAYYEKRSIETNYNSMVVVLDFESIEKMIEYLKDDDYYEPEDFMGNSFLMMIDNGNYIIAFESDYLNFYGWTNENKIIFVYLYPEEDYSGELYFPEEMVNAYLTKYPNDLGEHFINPLSDYETDLDNDGLYDFLTIRLNVTVPEDGEYKIFGELTDSYDNVVSEVEDLFYFEEGINTIELNFNGAQIFESNKNGPYFLNRIGVDGVNNDFDLGFDDVIYITSDYDYQNFREQRAEITEIVSEYGEDINNDGYYDYLILDVEVDVKEAGNYRIEMDMSFGENPELYSEFYQYYYLEEGPQTIPIKVSGSIIHLSQIDQSYTFVIELHDIDLDFEEEYIYETEIYNFKDFQPLSFSDKLIDEDENGLYDYIIIEAEIVAPKEGTYRLYAKLGDKNEYYLKYLEKEYYLEEGKNKVELKFSGLEAFLEGVDESLFLYELHLNLDNNGGNELGFWKNVYTTQEFNLEEFEKPGAEIIEIISDYGIDLDNDGLYDYLTVEVKLNVTKSGNYYLDAEIEIEDNDEIETSLSKYYNEGIHIVKLSFAGSEIYHISKNGPYYLDEVYLEQESLLLEHYDSDYWTKNYNYTDFDLTAIDNEAPSIQLNYPSDGYSSKVTSSKTINFQYIPNDGSSDISSCNLIIDDEVSMTDSTITKGFVNIFTKTLNKDTYDWKIKCIDSYGNEGFSETRELTIKKKSSSSGSSNNPRSTPTITFQESEADEDEETTIDSGVKDAEFITLGNSEAKEGNSKDVGELNRIIVIIMLIITFIVLIVIFILLFRLK
ncbi:hypothetical protein GOV12_07745 [Candidatus Pacearchaeota archaeon]|nr:hypothetical protein [Candidatus Pacearchaeota archaeon]